MIKKTQPHIIGIAGPSCSGKTALAKHIMEKLGQGNCSLIPLDSYYYDISHLSPREIEAHNYDLPDALEKNLLIKHIRTIADGNEIDMPVYDYVTHRRSSKKILVKPAEFILVEGLFVLYWEALRKVLSSKVFIMVNDSLCFKRRLVRDMKERGVRREYVSKQYETMVRPMYEQFIKPTLKYADLIVNGEDQIEKSSSNIMNKINKQQL